ncbi:LysR family transcriptional regulator [Schlegelella sp. S2-27]|uniref:LysR family transcriptional regulator n=1 Tax=Caldimonas mangrovi TaxID=2944811 RepID=A0ABT0YIW5_9BURK|nr:LysR family transcriptional regulator [Caldimonas mangrovi]MCM5678671.1 LysR family transcriptional regulator [Caldimonas mangrovi]
MNWDDLQYFLAVCRQGSVSGAASLLHVNHSTVLRRLASLESSLGVTLFDRLPGGYALTSAGNQLTEGLAGVAEQIESAQRRLMGADLSIQGTVRLTTTDTLAQGVLMPTLAAFQREHPQVQLQLVVHNSFSSLTQREADVAVRGTNRPPDNLVGRRVGTIRTGLYASRAYLKTLGRRFGPDDYRWVAPDESLSHLEQAKWLRANVPAERIAFRADTLVGMVEAVAQGFGVGLLLCPLADARPELTALAPPSPSLDTQLWVLTHPDLRQVARVRAFAQFLFDALSSDPRLQH